MSSGDELNAATLWNDGSGDFLYADGTVLCFGRRADAFVKISPPPEDAGRQQYDGMSSPPSVHGQQLQKEMFFTALALTRDEGKIRNALDVYNAMSPTPKLIEGLLPSACPQQFWTSPMPIDTVLVRERRPTRNAASGDNDAAEEPSGETTVAPPPNVERLATSGSTRVWDETRASSLTLHPNGLVATLRWPARVYDRDGVSTTFVAVDGGHFESRESIDISSSSVQHLPAATAADASLRRAAATRVKATRFCYMTRHVPVAVLRAEALSSSTKGDRPSDAVWTTMLRIAEAWHSAPAAFFAADDGRDADEDDMLHSLSLPVTLPPVDKTDSVVRFPAIESHHASSLLASPWHCHSAASTSIVHPVPAAVAARFVTGHFALWAIPNNHTAIAALSLQDLSCVQVDPQVVCDDGNPGPVCDTFKVVHAAGPRAPVWAHLASGEDGAQQHTAAIEFLYAADGSIPVPAPAGRSRAEAASSAGPPSQRKDAGPGLRSAASRDLERVVGVSVSVSHCNHGRARQGPRVRPQQASMQQQRTAPASDALNTSVSSAAQRGTLGGAIVRCGSSVTGVGTFTAFVDGCVRVVFDDRTILTVVPAPGKVVDIANGGQLRDDADTTVHVVDRMANKRLVRLSQIHPGHELHPYVTHAMAFAKFAELPEDARVSIASSPLLSGGTDAPNVASSATGYDAQLGVNRNAALDAVGVAIVRTRALLTDG